MVKGYYGQIWSGSERNIQSVGSVKVGTNKGDFTIGYSKEKDEVGYSFTKSQSEMKALFGKNKKDIPYLKEISDYMGVIGVEAGIIEGSCRYGIGAFKDLGRVGIGYVEKGSTGLGLIGVGISVAQVGTDIYNGRRGKDFNFHVLDLAVSSTLLGVTAFFPATTPVTLTIGIVYGTWTIFR